MDLSSTETVADDGLSVGTTTTTDSLDDRPWQVTLLTPLSSSRLNNIPMTDSSFYRRTILPTTTVSSTTVRRTMSGEYRVSMSVSLSGVFYVSVSCPRRNHTATN